MSAGRLQLPLPSHTEPLSRASSVFDLPRHELRISGSRTPDATIVKSHGRPVYGDSTWLVLSGGTGCNSICSAFDQASTCYVLPVTDDGGSSSEIIRVLGGPSIGDIRSRLLRLIPANAPPHVSAIRDLLSHRFSSKCTEQQARDEWREVVEGRSELWKGIPVDRKELIRGFLVYFENEVLRRAQKQFSFRNGSIGNFFLSAAQLFFRSLPSAIFQFSSITGSEGTILPVLVTNHTVTIAADLENGKKIIGQCNISHPTHVIQDELTSDLLLEGLEDDEPSTTPLNAQFEKSAQEQSQVLEARIQRVFYINAYGQEIYPSPNSEFVSNLGLRDYLVYSCGSLWTRLGLNRFYGHMLTCIEHHSMSCSAWRGYEHRTQYEITGQDPAASVHLFSSSLIYETTVNYKNDRETTGYTAIDYVKAITNTLNRHDLTPRTAGVVTRPDYPVSAFVTHLVYLSDTVIHVDAKELMSMGVACIAVKPQQDQEGFNAASVKHALEQIVRTEVD